MTTLFEETGNANPPSPSLELLDSSLKNNDLEAKVRVSTPISDAVAENSPPTVAVVASGTTGSSNASDTQSDGATSAVTSIGNDGTFTSFTVNDPNQLPPGVRVVHVQAVDPNQAAVQAVATVPAGSVGSPVNVTYTVGSSGQIHQVIQPNEGVTTVLESTQQDASRYTYYPGVQAADSGAQAGQFYVMMSPQDVIPVAGANPPRIIAPRSQQLTSLGDGTFTVEGAEDTLSVEFRKVETTRSSRDERRRATHNEVERRRRDKINTWIMKLAAVVPDCQLDQTKQGTSKGGVLSKALDFIVKLRGQNERMSETIKEQERILVENQVLRQQVEKLRQENAILQANLQLHQSEPMEEQKTLEE